MPARRSKQLIFTGEIVCFQGENLGVSTIVRRQFVPYKALISDFVAEQGLWEKSFLDFHGMVNNRPFDLAVGTGGLDAAAPVCAAGYSVILILTGSCSWNGGGIFMLVRILSAGRRCRLWRS